MSSDEAAIAQRAVQVLRGRPHHTWASWVGLSGGAVSRLLKGSLPDPVKLSGAIRAENLSLSWLVDGVGSPYLATSCGTQERLEGELAVIMGDEESQQAMLVTGAPDLHLVVLHQPAQVEMPALMNPVNYTGVTILSAPASGPLPATCGATRWSTLQLSPEEAMDIAGGYTSASELFGWPAEPNGKAAARQPLAPVRSAGAKRSPNAVRDQAATYASDSLARQVAELSPVDRAMVSSLIARLTGQG